jgi:hypothetical protein
MSRSKPWTPVVLNNANHTRFEMLRQAVCFPEHQHPALLESEMCKPLCVHVQGNLYIHGVDTETPYLYMSWHAVLMLHHHKLVTGARAVGCCCEL